MALLIGNVWVITLFNFWFIKLKLTVFTLCTKSQLVLKEQYPVTEHAPNFEFWTGSCEIKRCKDSKRTLKNPFALSHLAEFNTTLKPLRITDHWYIVPVLLLPLALNDQKMGSALMSVEGLFLLPDCIQAQVIVKGIRRNETATIKTVRKNHWDINVTEILSS